MYWDWVRHSLPYSNIMNSWYDIYLHTLAWYIAWFFDTHHSNSSTHNTACGHTHFFLFLDVNTMLHTYTFELNTCKNAHVQCRTWLTFNTVDFGLFDGEAEHNNSIVLIDWCGNGCWSVVWHRIIVIAKYMYFKYLSCNFMFLPVIMMIIDPFLLPWVVLILIKFS